MESDQLGPNILQVFASLRKNINTSMVDLNKEQLPPGQKF